MEGECVSGRRKEACGRFTRERKRVAGRIKRARKGWQNAKCWDASGEEWIVMTVRDCLGKKIRVRAGTFGGENKGAKRKRKSTLVRERKGDGRIH